jgi:hypothetical protein
MAASDCFVVGNFSTTSSNGRTGDQALIERWNARSWATQLSLERVGRRLTPERVQPSVQRLLDSMTTTAAFSRNGPRARPGARPIWPRPMPSGDQLQRWARRAKTSQVLALRARIVLACAESRESKKVAALRTTEHNVARDGDQPAPPRVPNAAANC